MRHLVDEAARRSTAIRAWLDRLENLDVTVYIGAKAFAQVDLEGRVALLPTGGSHRDLMIELACGLPKISPWATRGHELPDRACSGRRLR